MGRKSSKLFALAFCTTLIGIFFLSGYRTYAGSDGARENKTDILKRLGDYRSWTQIKKSENPITLVTGSITLPTIEIAASSVAG
jgi:hypothetical protein